MSAPERDAAWQRYLSTCRMGGTPDQRAFAFSLWWKLERADSLLACRNERQRANMDTARTVSVPGARKAA